VFQRRLHENSAVQLIVTKSAERLCLVRTGRVNTILLQLLKVETALCLVYGIRYRRHDVRAEPISRLRSRDAGREIDIFPRNQ